MENESKPNDATFPLVLIALGFLVGAVVVGACWLSSGKTESPRHNIVRNVTVDYMYETDPGSASGSSDLEVELIQFYPDYVVVTDTGGRTRLFAVNRLRRFSYKPTEK